MSDAVLAQERLFGAAGGVEDVVLGEALGAELAAIDGMVGIAAYGDGLVVAHADEHAAADGAVAAGGLDPFLRDARLGDVTEDGIFGVGVLVAAGVDAGESVDGAWIACNEEFTHAWHRPDEGEGHVERHDGDEEEVTGGDDSSESGGERKRAWPAMERRIARPTKAKETRKIPRRSSVLRRDDASATFVG